MKTHLNASFLPHTTNFLVKKNMHLLYLKEIRCLTFNPQYSHMNI